MIKKVINLILLIGVTTISFSQNNILPNYTEKVMVTDAFLNGNANQAIDIILGNHSFWGNIEVEITGSWWYQNAVGKLVKHYSVGLSPGGTIHSSESRVTEATGPVQNNVALGELTWDATNARFRIPISHIVSTQNSFTVKVKLFSHGGYAETVNNDLSVSSIYTLSSLPQNKVHFTRAVGIGTSQPGLAPNATASGSNALLEVNGNIRINTLSTAASGEIGNLQFLKAHTATTSTTYSTAEIRAFTTSGYDGGLKMYTSQHIGSGNYDLRPVMTLNHIGNVGIGTTGPENMLHLHGNAVARFTNSVTGNSNSDGLYIGNATVSSNDFDVRNYEASDLRFGTNNMEQLRIKPNGNIGIGTNSPSEKLSVNGNVRAKKIIVTQSGWPDYVFHPSYVLRPLKEVELFIQKYKHLPDIPSAKEVEEKGVSVGDNQALLLKKIEELTLYIIELKKENIKQQEEINALKKDK